VNDYLSKALIEAFSLMSVGDVLLKEIILTTLEMAFASSILALLLGVPFGVFIASSSFKGKKIVIVFMRTMMGLPPVVVGIFLYIIFSGIGPLGQLKLIYSVELMIIAQIVLITPVVAGMTETYVTRISPTIFETSKGIGLSRFKRSLLTINESKYEMVAIYLLAFSRAMAEVGAVQIVGGNILHKTRVMTTSIALNYSSGYFSLAIALGILLLFIVFLVNCIASIIQFTLSKNH